MRAGALAWPVALVLAGASVTPSRRAAAAETGPAARQWRPGDPIPSLAGAYRGQFLVGAALTSAMVQSGDAQRFLANQFNVIVAENEMKPLALAAQEGRYDFGAADALIDWAGKYRIKVRGHCLVWHRHEPPWMFTDGGKPASRDLLVQRLRTYIHDVVGHFKGRVWAWDVVNEAFVAYEPGVESVDGWRKSRWFEVLGQDYIGLAFQFAHEADPGALLFYNDYDTQNPAKRAMILKLIRSLEERGLPIHGIGHQAHFGLAWPDPAELEKTIGEVARLGLRNHVTEMDVSLRERWDAAVPARTPELLALQARRWADFFRMYRRNASNIDAVLLWGVNDEASWLQPPDAPLLFSRFQPKLAFWAVLDEAKSPDG